MLTLKNVTSAKLTQLGYDRDTCTLGVRFPPAKSAPAGSLGIAYDYFNVSKVLAARLLAPECESIGKLFIAEVQGPRSAPLHRFGKVVDETKPPLHVDRYAAGTEVPGFEPGKTLFDLVTSKAEPEVAADPTAAPSAEATTQTRAAAENVTVAPGEPAALVEASDGAGGVIFTDGKPVDETDEPAAETALEPAAGGVFEISTAFSQSRALVVSYDFVRECYDLEVEAREISLLQVAVVVVSSEEGRQPVFDELRAVRERSKGLQARVDALKAPLNTLRGEVLGIEKRIVEKLGAIAQSLDRALTTHRRAVEAETRRREQEAQAERDRLAREDAERQAEVHRQQALLDAEALRQAGQVEAAALIVANPEPVVIAPSRPVIMQTAAPRMAGERRFETWKWRYKNPSHPEGDFPITDPANHRYYSLDEKKVGADVRSQKNLFTHPGVETWPEDKTSTSGR